MTTLHSTALDLYTTIHTRMKQALEKIEGDVDVDGKFLLDGKGQISLYYSNHRDAHAWITVVAEDVVAEDYASHHTISVRMNDVNGSLFHSSYPSHSIEDLINHIVPTLL